MHGSTSDCVPACMLLASSRALHSGLVAGSLARLRSVLPSIYACRGLHSGDKDVHDSCSTARLGN